MIEQFVKEAIHNEPFDCGALTKDQWLQKFALLIVDESCRTLMEMHNNANGNHNYYHHASVELKKHFGIKYDE